MRKIFLDVGGFEGESSRAALDPLFGFDKVYCFEPVAACYESIRKTISNTRFQLVDAGLLDKTATLPVYSVGSLGASLYADAPQTGPTASPTEFSFIRATDYFREHINHDDVVWMKLNCEGAEIAILDDLLDSGEARKLREVLIDFDAVKIPSMRAHVERLEARLTTAPFSFYYPPEVQYGMVTHFGSIRNWLIVSGAAETNIGSRISSILYQIPYVCDTRYNGYYKIRLLRWLRLRPPPEQVPRELRSTWSRVEHPRGPYYRD
jgi:FkbM family methyltransferase